MRRVARARRWTEGAGSEVAALLDGTAALDLPAGSDNVLMLAKYAGVRRGRRVALATTSATTRISPKYPKRNGCWRARALAAGSMQDRAKARGARRSRRRTAAPILHDQPVEGVAVDFRRHRQRMVTPRMTSRSTWSTTSDLPPAETHTAAVVLRTTASSMGRAPLPMPGPCCHGG